MQRTTSRYLVVTHDATRTGAPRVAIEVQQALRDDGAEVISVLRAGGAMAGDFTAAADRSLREPFPRVRARLRRSARLHPFLNRWDRLVAGLVLRRFRPDVVILNTVQAASYLPAARRRGVPAVLYIHEMGDWAWEVLARHPVDRWDQVRLVTPSASCRDAVAEVLGLPPDAVEVLHPPVDVGAIRRRAASASPSAPSSAPRSGSDLVVAACGTGEEGKGIDLWLRVAQQVREQRPDLAVRFRWIGRQKDAGAPQLARDLGVEDIVDLVGEVADAVPLMAGGDVFTLPSRRDSFPLVVLEAMALGLPVVAFDVGGVAEQLGDAGLVVAAEDVELMAKSVITLLDDAAARRDLGERAHARAVARWDAEVAFRPALRRLVSDLRPA
jgi:glycosyltransferase involved in cell wall biosynthesis